MAGEVIVISTIENIKYQYVMTCRDAFIYSNVIFFVLRADSPGHCAKYGSYATLDLDNNTVLDIQLVQVGCARIM